MAEEGGIAILLRFGNLGRAEALAEVVEGALGAGAPVEAPSTPPTARLDGRWGSRELLGRPEDLTACVGSI
jgi:hypothetical protein